MSCKHNWIGNTCTECGVYWSVAIENERDSLIEEVKTLRFENVREVARTENAIARAEALEKERDAFKVENMELVAQVHRMMQREFNANPPQGIYSSLPSSHALGFLCSFCNHGAGSL